MPNCRQRILSGLTAAWLILTTIAPAHAAVPNEDFAEWYREWAASAPQNFALTFTQFFDHKPGAPLVMKVTNWSSGEFRLGTVTNSVTKKSYRFIVNPDYAASLESVDETSRIWRAPQFAPRGDAAFGPLAKRTGSDPLFLGPATIFDAEHQMKTTPATVEGKPQAQVEFTFPKTDIPRPRDPQTIVVTLDGSAEWMPIEIKQAEFGGMLSRKKIEGWHVENGNWLFTTITSFIRLPESKTEVIHSTERWDFASSAGARDDRADCYFRFYNLPEPPPAKSGWWRRGLIFMAAIVLLPAGYAILKRWQA